MLHKFIYRILSNFIALGAAVYLLEGISYGDNPWVLVIAALIFSAVNMLLRPIVVLLSLPFIVITLGLFTFLINAGMLYLTAALYDKFDIASFGVAFLAALIIGFVNMILNMVFGD